MFEEKIEFKDFDKTPLEYKDLLGRVLTIQDRQTARSVDRTST